MLAHTNVDEVWGEVGWGRRHSSKLNICGSPEQTPEITKEGNCMASSLLPIHKDEVLCFGIQKSEGQGPCCEYPCWKQWNCHNLLLSELWVFSFWGRQDGACQTAVWISCALRTFQSFSPCDPLFHLCWLCSLSKGQPQWLLASLTPPARFPGYLIRRSLDTLVCGVGGLLLQNPQWGQPTV